jgi:hypothetical protein
MGILTCDWLVQNYCIPRYLPCNRGGGVSMFGGFDPTSALKKRQEKNVPQKGKINFVFKPIC